MHFARPLSPRPAPGAVLRSDLNIERSITLLAQEIIVAERHLALLESQRRYLEMELAELKTVRERPMFVIRPPRRETKTVRQPARPRQRDDGGTDLLAAIEAALRGETNG